MKPVKLALALILTSTLIMTFSSPATAFLNNKFEREMKKETRAVKLVREVQQGQYDLVTTEELKKWMDQDKELVVRP